MLVAWRPSHGKTLFWRKEKHTERVAQVSSREVGLGSGAFRDEAELVLGPRHPHLRPDHQLVSPCRL